SRETDRSGWPTRARHRRREIAGAGGPAAARDQAARASSGLAGIGQRTGVAVVTRRAVRLSRVRAEARGRIAGACDVALIRGRTGDGVAARAGSRLTGIRLGTRVAIVTGRAVGLVRVGAEAGARIACTRDVALIRGRADDGVA